ncbi:MAG: threonine--tRNA ligase [Rhizobiales bacterium]|nr:threonine--tRNA ligase [Hyphomicrobiales bacterium]
MIKITFPDGATREYDKGQNGFDIAASISKSLSKKAVAIMLNGEMQDLAEPILVDAKLSIVLRDDEAALELIRHDAAHVMAEAVQELFPGTQVTIGPVIENGFYYDFARDEPFHAEDLEKIEAKMRQIIGRDEKFTKQVWSRSKAKEYFASIGEDYKVELVDMIPEDEDVKIYNQGKWLDLCRGPHLPSTGKIGNNFKLMKLAGAYWRGNSDNAMLQRIYGTAWASEKQLKQYLFMLEEAEKRDHRKLGAEMNLFHFQNEAPGSVFWHPKGWRLFSSLIEYMRRKQNAGGYLEVNTPDMLDKGLWEQSGHWAKYGDNMFTTETPDDRVFALKPMNCPGHVQVFKNGLRSYKELPIRLGEFGKVHRYEPSGALHGLMRVRSFTQDDAHIFCTEDQINAEVVKTNQLILEIYKDFGFEEISVRLSTRPENRVGSDEVWDKAENALKVAIDAVGVEWDIDEGEGAFYGPKLEYVLRDAIGRYWTCGTLQLNFNLPERFGSFYIDKDGEKQTPVMLHRAMFGSLERFTGILIEHHAGAFPMWLAPQQVVVCPIVSDMDDYALEVQKALLDAGTAAEVDLRNEKINYKIREHSLQKIPAIFVVGGREKENGTVAIRRFGSKAQTILPLDEAVAAIAEEAKAPDQR